MKMAAFDKATLVKWLRGQEAAARRSSPLTPWPLTWTHAIELGELAWPVAHDALNQQLHEEQAAEARAVWVRLAKLTRRTSVKPRRR